MTPSDPATWPRHLHGYRRETDELVFTCGCGCGGHVAIQRERAVACDVYRHRAHTAAFEATGLACFGESYFIQGHAPLGLAARELRVGHRTRLRPTS